MFHKDDPEYNHNQVCFYSLDLLISSDHFIPQVEDSIDCSFVYDEHFDTYLCLENQGLTYRTTTPEAYREYKSDPNICVSCLLLSQCPPNKNRQEVVKRHIWRDALEICEDIRHQTGMKERYQNRKETTERLFGTVKECHHLRYT